MIRVIREPKPAILTRKETQWLHSLQQATTPSEKEAAQNRYRHPQIRAALERMCHGKCAYCESKILHVSYAHIEHYRPKSRFPNLTFDWDNLLLACGLCNSAEYKGDNFPDTSQNGPIINPCVDDPTSHFEFRYDIKTKLASVYGTTSRGVTTEQMLSLNRSDLRTYRSRQITRLAYIALKAKTDPRAKELLDQAKEDASEYAAFASTFTV